MRAQEDFKYSRIIEGYPQFVFRYRVFNFIDYYRSSILRRKPIISRFSQLVDTTKESVYYKLPYLLFYIQGPSFLGACISQLSTQNNPYSIYNNIRTREIGEIFSIKIAILLQQLQYAKSVYFGRDKRTQDFLQTKPLGLSFKVFRQQKYRTQRSDYTPIQKYLYSGIRYCSSPIEGFARLIQGT